MVGAPGDSAAATGELAATRHTTGHSASHPGMHGQSQGRDGSPPWAWPPPGLLCCLGLGLGPQEWRPKCRAGTVAVGRRRSSSRGPPRCGEEPQAKETAGEKAQGPEKGQAVHDSQDLQVGTQVRPGVGQGDQPLLSSGRARSSRRHPTIGFALGCW